MHTYCLLLLMCFPFMCSLSSSCDLCMCPTWAGNVVTRTLLSILRILVQALSYTHNQTVYSVCSHGNQHIFFNPTYQPRKQWLKIRIVHNPGNLISHTQVFSPDKPVWWFFDACVAIEKGGYEGIGYGCGLSLVRSLSVKWYMYVLGWQLLAMWWCGFSLLSLLKLCFMGHMAED
jgi:hypothetical protein